MNNIAIERNIFDREFVAWAKDKPDVVALSADLTRQCELGGFAATYPERFLSMGIAEQNMLGAAGGLAYAGKLPFVFTYGTFLTRRALEQLQLAIALPNRKVRLISFVCGICSPAGPTHQAIDDVNIMRAIPNMTVVECVDATEVRAFLKMSEDIEGPIYVRMGRGALPKLFPDAPVWGKSRVLTEGSDIVVASASICTQEAMRAVAALTAKGLSVHHVHVASYRPFDDEALMTAIANSKYGVISMENHLTTGGLGSIIADHMVTRGIGKKLYRLGVEDQYLHAASTHYLMMHETGMNAMALIQKVEEATGQSFGIESQDLDAEIQLDVLGGC